MKVEHWSGSSIAMIAKCPRQFYYRYIEGWKQPPSAAIAFGLSYHQTVDASFKQALNGFGHLNASQAKHIFRSEFDRAAEHVDWKEESPGRGVLVDQGTSLVGEYVENYAPNRRARDSELEFSFNLPDLDEPFVGRIDLIGDEYILDHKTSSRMWTQDRADQTIQVEAYYLAYRALKGKYPSWFAFDIAVKTAAPKIQFNVMTLRTQQHLNIYQERIYQARDMVEKELFPRTDPSNWYCSQRWCGYYDHCMRGVPMHQLRLEHEDQWMLFDADYESL